MTNGWKPSRALGQDGDPALHRQAPCEPIAQWWHLHRGSLHDATLGGRASSPPQAWHQQKMRNSPQKRAFLFAGHKFYCYFCILKNQYIQPMQYPFISEAKQEEQLKEADVLENSPKVSDHEKAFKIYSLLDAQGNLYAKACLGYCYCRGKGVEKDEEKGITLIRISADAGNGKGQTNLGACCFRPIGQFAG